jgi:hypothetical protein
MTDFTQLMEDYRAMTMASDRHFKGWAPAPITPVVATREQHLYGQKELADALLAVSSELEGWLLFSDRLAILDSNSTPSLQGRVLSGEVYRSAVSVRVSPAGNDQWLWAQTEITPAEAESATHLASSLEHLATDTSLGKLRYRQLWCRDELGRLRVEDAVFEGFQETCP